MIALAGVCCCFPPRLDDWPGRGDRRTIKTGVRDCLKKALSFPNKNAALIGGGVLSTPAVGLDGSSGSIEISPCKLSMPTCWTHLERGVFLNWQQELSQDHEVGINWRSEFANALPDEGKELEDATWLTAPEGKLPGI